MVRPLSIVASLAGVIVCGTIGGVAAWALVMWIGLGGVAGSIVAAIVGMVIAVAAWIVVATLARRLVSRKSGG